MFAANSLVTQALLLNEGTIDDLKVFSSSDILATRKLFKLDIFKLVRIGSDLLCVGHCASLGV